MRQSKLRYLLTVHLTVLLAAKTFVEFVRDDRAGVKLFFLALTVFIFFLQKNTKKESERGEKEESEEIKQDV